MGTSTSTSSKKLESDSQTLYYKPSNKVVLGVAKAMKLPFEAVREMANLWSYAPSIAGALISGGGVSCLTSNWSFEKNLEYLSKAVQGPNGLEMAKNHHKAILGEMKLPDGTDSDKLDSIHKYANETGFLLLSYSRKGGFDVRKALESYGDCLKSKVDKLKAQRENSQSDEKIQRLNKELTKLQGMLSKHEKFKDSIENKDLESYQNNVVKGFEAKIDNSTAKECLEQQLYNNLCNCDTAGSGNLWSQLIIEQLVKNGKDKYGKKDISNDEGKEVRLDLVENPGAEPGGAAP